MHFSPLSKGALLFTTLVAIGGLAWYLLNPQGITYRVVRGDTLFEIAQIHGVTVSDLRAWNGISGDLIEVDQILKIYPADGGSEIPTTATTRRAPRVALERPPEDVGSWRTLTHPTPEPCILFDPELGDQDIVSPDGLSYSQLAAGLKGIVNETLRCEPESGVSEIAILFELTVGCDGVVASIRAADRGGASEQYADCVAEVLEYADFPAHDIAGGMTFQYPLSFSFP